jgi:hypothetical protein
MNDTTDLTRFYRDAVEWDRRFLAGERLLTEGRLRPPPPPPQVAALIEAVEREVELNETRSLPEARPVLDRRELTDAPRPPTSAPKASTTDAPAEEGRDLHARLHAALSGQPYVPVPEGVHRRLAEALTGKILDESHQPLPKGIHERLRRALL